MSVHSNEMTDEEVDREIAAFARLHGVKILKAPIVATMAGLSIWIFSESIRKTLTVAIICAALSAFNTWRKFLEPLVFWCLAVATVYWIKPDILDQLKSLAH